MADSKRPAGEAPPDEAAAKRARAAEEREWHIILFYKYAVVADPEALVEWHREFCAAQKLTGRVLVAGEGINGTLTGDEAAVAAYTAAVEARPEFEGIQWKRSTARSAENPFPDTYIRHVRELISSGGKFHAGLGPGGEHLDPREFHRVLEETPNDELFVLDVRNHKECMLGGFRGAVDPQTRVFSETPDWIDRHAEELKKKKVVAMYCTGGIRCERTSQYVRAKLGDGPKVVQLHGGIHKYLEAFPDGGLYRGKNFVFDRRGAMGPQGGGEVVGRCSRCEAPWDEFDARAVCTVCRDPLLVCPPCREALQHEFHCETHAKLAKCYFTFLDVFTADELGAQRAALDAMHTALKGHEHKNRRRTVRRQMEKVDARLAELKAGARVVPRDEAGVRCRSCGSGDCKGACWGFYAKREA